MVEVFKMNVQLQEQAILLAGKLLSEFPLIKINFDLEDCDKVLRIEGEKIAPKKIIEMISSNGYQCNILE